MIKDEQKISIEIPKDHISKIIDFLILEYIPFQLTYSTTELKVEKGKKKQYDTQESIPIHNSSEVATTKKYDLLINKYLDKSPSKFSDITKELNISKQTFKNRFKEQYGKSFYQVCIEKRMEYASELLKKGQTATYISKHLGYSHPIKIQ